MSPADNWLDESLMKAQITEEALHIQARTRTGEQKKTRSANKIKVLTGESRVCCEKEKQN